VRHVLAGVDAPAAERLGAVEALLDRLDKGQPKAPCLAARQREILAGQSAQIRPLIGMLLALDLRSDEPARWHALLDTWRVAYYREFDYVSEQLCTLQSRAWAQLCQHPDGVLAFHAAEAQLLWEVRQALRRGSLFVPHSLSFRSPRVMFDSSDTTVRAPGSERDPVEFLDQLCATARGCAWVSEEELLYVYVALLGHAMDIGATRLSLMAPGLSVNGLTDALQLLEEPGPLRRANAATVEFLQSHPLASYWGNTIDCAADAMSLYGTRHLWLARTA
jgi:hypothetical protein